jgi:hypothetical protein
MAGFKLQKMPFGWIRVPWDGMDPALRKRLAQGITGYRYLGQFKDLYLFERLAPDAPNAGRCVIQIRLIRNSISN